MLITGTSTGFGRLAAVEMARRGWRVVATMRDLRKSGSLEKAVAAAVAVDGAGLGDRVHVESLDVTRQDSIERGWQRTLELTGGRLDAIVHNAGVAVGGAFEDLPDDEMRRVMETNFWGVLALTRAALPTMRAQREGRILVVSSNSAYTGEPSNSIYCASKWAIEGWAESLAFEVAPFGLDVVLVEPGPYRTEIWNSSARILPDGSAYTAFLHKLEGAVEERVIKTARDPQEVALVIADALESRRPRFRYPVGPQARMGLALRGVLPTTWHRRIITRLLGLPRVGG